MAASFENLLGGFGQIACLTAPEILPDAKGRVAVVVRMRGVEVSVVQTREVRPDVIFLFAHVGAPGDTRTAAGWTAMLDANLKLAWDNPPAFCRNAKTGEALLQWACPIENVTPVELYQRIAALVDVVERLNDGHPPVDAVAAFGRAYAPPPRSAAELERARNCFLQIHGEVSAAPCARSAAPATAEDPMSCTLEHDGFTFEVIHSSISAPESAIVLLPLGILETDSGLDEIVKVLDANFELVAEPGGATFGRDPSSGALILMYTHPLGGATAQQLCSRGVETALAAGRMLKGELG